MTDNPVQRMFQYWNEAFCSIDGFTEAGFARYFTPDAVLRVNGSDRPTGPAGLAGHFNRIRAAAEKAAICMPLSYTFRSEDDLFIHYKLDLVIGGVAGTEEAMGYCKLNGPMIAFMNVISHQPG